MATDTTIKYGDTVTAGYAPGQSGTAVFDPKTGKALEGAGAYNPNTGAAITSDQLAPVTPLKLPDAAPQTNAGLAGVTDALVSQTKTADQLAADQLKQNQDSSLQQLIDATLQSGSISSSVDRTAQDTAKQNFDQYTSQLEQEQLAARRQAEQIANSAGLQTASQRDAAIADVNRKSLSKQADIAILQTSANRQYDTAASIADRAVQAKLEQSTANLNALKYVYENNKEAFTTAENRLYQAKIKEEDAALKKEEELQKTIADIKINVAQSDAPNKLEILNNLSNATSLDDALKVAGKYSGDYLKQELLKQQIKTEKAQQSNYYANASKTNAEAAQLGIPGSGKPLTDAQIQYAGYADRISQANTVIDSNASTFANMNYAQFKLASSTSQLANSLLTPEQRQIAQAMQNFITAKLRKESGASISPTEFETARIQYFPALGDDQKTLAQKKALRDSVLQNNILGAGPAYAAQLNSALEAPNLFQQATGINTQIFNTKYMNVTPDGSLSWTLPLNTTKK